MYGKIIVHDKGSQILSSSFNLPRIELYLQNKVSFSEKEIEDIENFIKKDIQDVDYILYGSNRYHFLTYIILRAISRRKRIAAYIHIDQHSDDYELVTGVSSGNFVRFIARELELPVIYVGFLKPEHPELFSDILLIRKDHKNIREIKRTLSDVDLAYLSIDLDILKYKYNFNFYSKGINYLLDLDELIYLVKDLHPMMFDINGFLYTRSCKPNVMVNTYRSLVNTLVND